MAAIRYKELLCEIVPHYEPRPPKSKWVISIEGKLEQGHQDNMPGSWAKLSIYRIPCHLKHGEDKAWVPQIVSLGPYHHHGEKHLLHMERHKWQCLHRILERSGQDIGLYLDLVKKVEWRARAGYEGRISMSCDEFVEMMVLDGCFVIEMFRGFVEGFKNLGYPLNDPVFSMQPSILQIQRDMIMLENQIPLFILDQLLGLQFGDPNQKGCVAKLAIQSFKPLMPTETLTFNPLYNHDTAYYLDGFRWGLLLLGPKRSKTKPWSQRRQWFKRCLTELREAGIKVMPSPSRILVDIKFKNGILKIPRLKIHKGTRLLFLNLIAFEQSHLDRSNQVTSYVIFMRNLINSHEDVRYLCSRGIIRHCLESDAQLIDLFNRLCREVDFDIRDSYFPRLTFDLELYYEHWAFLTRKWNAWVAILKNKYFDNPWSIISLVAAFALLVLTFIQAFYAVYAYYRPYS
ncbi:hypothetical protein BT93_F3305 [Corymbia citriodora subsp. variegata]|nr:hypothetical protein BT93_F3305 [Corymbia citriodora subsp. variegata]